MTWNQEKIHGSRGKALKFSEADDAFIIAMVEAGLSTRMIAERMTPPRTKNAIVGRTHRLMDQGFLQKRPTPVYTRRSDSAPVPERITRHVPTLPPLPSAVVAPKPPPPKPVLVAHPVPVERPPRPMRANNGRGCQFMFETGRWPRYEPCGAPRVCHPATGVVQSWCDEHAGRVFAHWARFKAPERQDIAA